jgi:hypothetical protein
MCAQKIEDQGTITLSQMDYSFPCMETRFHVVIFSGPELLSDHCVFYFFLQLFIAEQSRHPALQYQL